MLNNFPRIYSLSTIGIKQHFNADYLFHPYRTDFSGESGSGKSMIADMIQLILVGSSEFKSATDGNKKRDVKGMLLGTKGNSTSRGYIFLNIEIKPKQYISIGAYIEGTSNMADMFIIQNGYDWEELTNLTTPILAKDLIINNKIETLKNLCEKFEIANMKSFKRKSYHQILFNNDILSLDLTKNETLKTFASILRSFSRGKGFKIESENLKKFLFGDDEQNIILEKYKEEVNNINNDFHEHKRYLAEINLINEKWNLLEDALTKSNNYKTIYTKYLNKRFNFWNTLQKKAITEKEKNTKNLDETNLELQFIENLILKLDIKELEELLDTKERIIEFNEKNELEYDIENKFLEVKQFKLNVEKVKKWLKINDEDLEKVKDWFFTQKKENNAKNKLEEFNDYLTNEEIVTDFETSYWLKDFDNAQEKFSIEIDKLEKEINEQEALSKFSDINNPESLLRWATENLKFPISYEIESILIYFQKYGRVKPSEENSKRYIPEPEELFNKVNDNIKEISEKGFWLNLDGVHEFVECSKNRVLDIDNPKELINSIVEFKDKVNSKLQNLNSQIETKRELKETLFQFSNLKEHVKLYGRKDELSEFKIHIDLEDITEDSFNNLLNDYKREKKIEKKYDELKDRYQKHLNKKNTLDNYTKRVKQLESDFFDEDSNVDDSIIESRIVDSKEQLLEQEKNFEKKQIDVFQKKYSKHINDKSKLIGLRYDTLESRKDLLVIKKEKEDHISVSEEELDETNRMNVDLFKSTIKFNNEAEEFTNPDEGGNNSLKYKADSVKSDYKAYLRLITKDSPYDDSVSIGQLANYLLPTVFPTSKVNEDLINNNIADRLNKLTKDIQEIGSRKVEILGDIFNQVYKVYTGYLTKINEINSYLKKKNKGITGGNRASLSYKKSVHYPENWLSSFRKQLNNQMNYTGLFSDLREEIDINKMMIKAFQKLGGSAKVEPEDLMDPKSYFDLDFHLKLDNDEINSGSNGQTYTANALLCLARISLIEEKDVGLKIMPIDEAEGLGSNYDMLHELAEEEKYQIVTMAIETAGEITDDGQYIYIMNENNLADMENFVPPLGIFSDEVFEDINEYINRVAKNG
ncbi:hypothetical protein [Tenacibaculum jejuense]|uniref:MukB N-terminal domain-containing protein n=1 Tax=Tenacibaculum jejuense TaxID=584609 RepID=A0A238UBT3_9FLAO|nr:hypothetical protein [Tenacibaculum jejuense]SNR16663.1 conserved protein of unknown function [Tenacibaculum jejuense]